MKVVITGSNGFIGSYMAKFLLNRGYTVVATAKQFHESTMELLAGAALLSLDVLNKEQLYALSIDADVIIHTATANDIISKDPGKGIELSAVGTKNILDFAVQNNIRRCIVFSTLQVYGTELSGHIDENSALDCMNDYGLNHLYAEMYAAMYSRQKKVECVSVRPGNVYGRLVTKSFNRWSLVPGCFCKEAVESGSITIQSSGRQLRNFINLENLSRTIDCIIQHFPDSYECYNLASYKCATMLEVAETVKAVFENKYQKKIQLNINGKEPLATNQFSISMDKLEKIGFTEDNNYTLETEITELFNYLDTN